MKQMNFVWLELSKLYKRLDASEHSMADRVLCEWVLSDDPTVRSDAIYVIRDRGIKSAVPALQELVAKLSLVTASQARIELSEIRKLMNYLDGKAPDTN